MLMKSTFFIVISKIRPSTRKYDEDLIQLRIPDFFRIKMYNFFSPFEFFPLTIMETSWQKHDECDNSICWEECDASWM